MYHFRPKFPYRKHVRLPVAGAALLVAACAPAAQERKTGQLEAANREVEGSHTAQTDGSNAAQECRTKPRTREYEAERRAMATRQIEARGVRDPAVLEATRSVPRHWFVPERLQRMAYGDHPIPIGEGQTISQPYIVALMTEALSLTPESKVLEIGTGSGYQAAVLSEITPHVYSIEIVEALARRAIETFERHGYDEIEVRIGDGYAGWPERAPFDAIIVTCAPDHVPPKLVEQLKPGGRMCIPVGAEHGVQELHVLIKEDQGHLRRQSMIPVRFVPMTGEAQQRERAEAER